MRIHKIVNNNVVVSRDDQEREVVLMGKGLAYQKRVGAELDSATIDKIYHLEQPEVKAQFHEHLDRIPSEYFIYAATIKEFAESKLAVQLQETVYLSLADHLYGAALRKAEGVQLGNEFHWEVKHFYPLEYQTSREALTLLADTKNFSLPKIEIVSVALHICHAQLTEGQPSHYLEVAQNLRAIVALVEHRYQTTFDPESSEYTRFVTHIRFFLVHLNESREEKGLDLAEDFFAQIQTKYSEVLSGVEEISTYLQQVCHVTIHREEKIYLAIHLVRLLRKSKSTTPVD